MMSVKYNTIISYDFIKQETPNFDQVLNTLKLSIFYAKIY